MKLLFISLIAVLAMSLSNCANNKPVNNINSGASLIAWPMNWANYLNKEITVEGTAVDAKLGALLIGDGPDIWIDNLDAWPTGFYLSGRQGKKLRVTGLVIEKDDLPVFVPKETESPKAGIPVDKESDLEKMKKRFLLKDAKWIVLEN